jgi:hypothetical protein
MVMCLLVVVVLGGLVGWRERHLLLTWYTLHHLARADEAGRDAWIERVAGLGEQTVPGLVEGLGSANPQVCANMQAALARLLADWGPQDARFAWVVGRLAAASPSLTPTGQCAALDLVGGGLAGRSPDNPLADRLVPGCVRLLDATVASTDPALQGAALRLVAELLPRPAAREVLPTAREVVRAGLGSGEPAHRLRAIQLALHPDVDQVGQVVALLQDPSAEVRRVAYLAVGTNDQVIRDEGLLPGLHDSDPEVRKICEGALRARGLKPEHLQLGRLLTAPQPGTRLEVLDYLGQSPDLDPGLWLRRLSHDPSPAVRVAALRAMSQQNLVDLSDRIDQMARTDPSPTVCQVARFYLGNHRQTGVPAPLPPLSDQ